MATDVIMPKVDMDQETGTVTKWLKKEGEEVKQGETLLEIETDKVAIEVEAPAGGILSHITAKEGDTVPIATTIAIILAPGETPPAPSDAPKAQEAPQPAEEPAQPLKSGNGVPITPVARNLAQAAGVDIVGLAGTGRGGKVTRRDVEAALAADEGASAQRDKAYATPAARRLAAEQGLDLLTVPGSGPHGRVQAADVSAAAHSPEAAVSSTGLPAYEAIPLRGKRRTIAERLTASYQNAPHITFTARIDMSAFEAARAQLNAHLEKEGARISATALLVKIVAQTLTRHPWLNSALVDDEIRLYREVHMGVAVALEDGLIVPVVRQAASKGTAQIAAEIRGLAERARKGGLQPGEVRHGTFTISNLGPFGVEQFTAIINPPQAAILAVGAAQPEVVPDPQNEGQVAIRPIMRITLAADHRVVDGAVAARFLADLKAALEAPVLLLL